MNKGSEIKNGEQKEHENNVSDLNFFLLTIKMEKEAKDQFKKLEELNLSFDENKNLKDLFDKNSELKKEFDETEQLISTELKIKTIAKFDEIVDKMTNLGFSTVQEAEEKAKKLLEDSNKQVKTEADLEFYIKTKKFFFYLMGLCDFLSQNSSMPNDGYSNLFNNSDQETNIFTQITGICISTIFKDKHTSYSWEWDYATNKITCEIDRSKFFKFTLDTTLCSIINFCTNSLIPLLKLQYEPILYYIAEKLNCYRLLNYEMISLLCSDENRCNQLKQFHKALYENLTGDIKDLFANSLNKVANVLQDVKHEYKRQVINLTAIVIFGIIASSMVLTIYFLEIYAVTWFFWFGIVGVVLTVAVGCRLGYCLLQSYKEIKAIDCAIEVYDLDKIKNFEEPEQKKILTLGLNEKENETIPNNNKIADKPKDGSESETINTEPDKTDSQFSQWQKNLS